MNIVFTLFEVRIKIGFRLHPYHNIKFQASCRKRRTSPMVQVRKIRLLSALYQPFIKPGGLIFVISKATG